MRPLSLVALLTLFQAHFCLLPAQRLEPYPYHAWEPRLAEAPAAHALPKAPDYRWEGMIVGGTAGALFGGWFGHGMCEWSESPHKHCLLATVGGAAIGGIVGIGMGGLIGGLFPKAGPEESNPRHDSWRGP